MNKVDFFGHKVTKLIVGDNPFNGHSYITDRVPGAEMKSYYTSEKIKENIKTWRQLGVPVGLGTHVPEVIERSEEENWGVDFYLACMQNARRGRRGEQSGFLTGKTIQKNPVGLCLICTFTKQIFQQVSSVYRTKYLPVLTVGAVIHHLYMMTVRL